MQESQLSIEDPRIPASTSGSARLPYLCPEVEVQHVELEGDCLATASVAGAGGTNPGVGDWGTDPTPADPGNTGDLSL